MLLSVALALAAQAPKPPRAEDLSNAWYARIPTMGYAIEMPHCPQVSKFKAKSTVDPTIYDVRYSLQPKSRFAAKLRFDGSKWEWLSGDLPRCDVMVQD